MYGVTVLVSAWVQAGCRASGCTVCVCVLTLALAHNQQAGATHGEAVQQGLGPQVEVQKRGLNSNLYKTCKDKNSTVKPLFSCVLFSHGKNSPFSKVLFYKAETLYHKY